jgi:hypothetical protein
MDEMSNPEVDPLPRTPGAAVAILDLLLPLGFDQLQHPELLFRDIGQRDRQAHVLRVENPEAPAYQDPIRRGHGLFEQVLRALGPVADIDRLPAGAARRAVAQLRPL